MPTSVECGLLAMIAEDMYVDGELKPEADARVAAVGWDIVANLTAQDVLIPSPRAPGQRLGVDPTKRVFFGFLAKSRSDPTVFAAVVRGTEGIIEWLIDAEFLLIPHPRHANVKVEQGFWNIYQTMSLADPVTGLTTFQNAAEGIAKTVGDGSVVVAGHSLGSALATYLTDDLAERLGPRVSACLFASPRTGDAAWVALFASTVTAYQLYNYILDLVTHVPSLGYATLPRATVLQPAAAQANIRLDILCNHHAICYCAMIDYAAEQTAQTTLITAKDTGCVACISSPPMSEVAKGLAAIINEFGVGDAKAVAMLKAFHDIKAA
jgi:triacylglycerol lipase